MQGLYKAVIKGKYNPIPTQYSIELAAVVQKMLA
jgi:hypothetical protein